MLSTAKFLGLIDSNTTEGEKIELSTLLSQIQAELGREDTPKLGENGQIERDLTGRVIMIKGPYRYSVAELKTKYSQTVSGLSRGTVSLKIGGRKLGQIDQAKLADLIKSRVIAGKRGRQGGELDPSLFGGFGADLG